MESLSLASSYTFGSGGAVGGDTLVGDDVELEEIELDKGKGAALDDI